MTCVRTVRRVRKYLRVFTAVILCFHLWIGFLPLLCVFWYVAFLWLPTIKYQTLRWPDGLAVKGVSHITAVTWVQITAGAFKWSALKYLSSHCMEIGGQVPGFERPGALGKLPKSHRLPLCLIVRIDCVRSPFRFRFSVISTFQVLMIYSPKHVILHYSLRVVRVRLAATIHIKLYQAPV